MMKRKTVIKTINGNAVEMTEAQSRELERDGMVIVGDRIIRTGAYVRRVHGSANESIKDTARLLFG